MNVYKVFPTLSSLIKHYKRGSDSKLRFCREAGRESP